VFELLGGASKRIWSIIVAADQKREVRIYSMVVGTWMVCLILFGVVQLLGWIRV
jgi:hypothetical protein